MSAGKALWIRVASWLNKLCRTVRRIPVSIGSSLARSRFRRSAMLSTCITRYSRARETSRSLWSGIWQLRTTRDGLPDPGPPWSYLGSMREKPRQVVGDLWHCSALRACRMYDLSLAAASLLSSVYPIKASFSLRFGSKKEKSLLLCLHLQQ